MAARARGVWAAPLSSDRGRRDMREHLGRTLGRRCVSALITTVSARARPGRPRKPDSDCHWGLGTPHSWPSLSPTPPRASALR
eukprot:361377-Prymnesium_polylepis.1